MMVFSFFFVCGLVEMMVYGAIRPVGMEISLAYLPVGFAHLCSSFSQIMPKCKKKIRLRLQ